MAHRIVIGSLKFVFFFLNYVPCNKGFIILFSFQKSNNIPNEIPQVGSGVPKKTRS